MKDTKKHVKSRQLHNLEGCSLEDKVELEDKEKALSGSLTSDRRQNDRNMYDSMLIEKILDRDNMNEAFKRVKKNKGSHGIDRLTIDELQEYLREHGEQLRKIILEGNYTPNPVRSVYSPQEVCKILDVGLNKIYELLSTGQIPSKRVGRKYIIPIQKFNSWCNETDQEKKEKNM